MQDIKKIFCPIDLQEHSEVVAEYAVMMAKAFNAEVVVLHVSPVFTDIGGHQEINTARLQEMEHDILTGSESNLMKFVDRHFEGVKVTARAMQGHSAELILEELKKSGAQMVIMGTHGRTGLNKLLFGSVAEKVVKSSPVPVLTVRPA